MSTILENKEDELSIDNNKVKFNIIELKERLEKIILDNKDNIKLIKYVSNEFVLKGLYYYIPQQLFEGNRDIEELNNIELICLTKSLCDFTGNGLISPYLYFSNTELISYDTWVDVPDDYPDYLLFTEVRKINSRSYSIVLSAKQASEMRKHRQYIYYKAVQRPAKNFIRRDKTVGSKASINKAGVFDLRERFLKRNIFPTQIAWAVLLYEGKKPQVSFNPISKQHSSIGDLKIIYNWDREDVNYTPFIINDGFHRFTALADAYDKHLAETGEELDYSLTSIINLMTEEEARTYTLDSFKRNFANEDELKVMEVTSENKFVDSLIEKSQILKDNTTTIFKNIKMFNSYTSKEILSQAIKLSNFDTKDEIEVEIQSTKCAKIIDLIINRLCKEYFENDINKLKKTYLLNSNTFVGYIALADMLKNDRKYISKIPAIVDELYLRLDEQDIKDLKLKNKLKESEFKEVYNYFQKIVEVI